MTPKRNLIANFAGQVWVAAIGIAFVPVYIKYLGMEAYGLIGVYVVLQSWFSLLDLGISTTINREMARASAGSIPVTEAGNLLRSLEFVVFAFAILVFAVIYFGASPISMYWLAPQELSPDTVQHTIQIIAIVVATRFCEGFYKGALYGLERQVFYNAAFAALSTLRYAGAAVLLSLSPSIEAFFLWQAFTSLCSVIVFASATHILKPKSDKPAQFSRMSLYSIAAFAGGLSITSVFALAFTQVDKVILSRLTDLESFGRYMLAASLAGLFATLTTPISSAFFPRFTAAVSVGDRETERYLFHTGTQLVAVVVCPALMVFVFLGTPLMHAWTGNSVLASEVGNIIALLAIGGFSNAMLQIPFMLQLAHGWTTLSVVINFFGVLFLVPSVFFGATYFGITGAAAGWAVTNVLVLTLASLTMHRQLLCEELNGFIRDSVVFPLCASAFTVGIFLNLLGEIEERMANFVLIVIAGMLAFASAVLATPIGRRAVRGALLIFKSKVAKILEATAND